MTSTIGRRTSVLLLVTALALAPGPASAGEAVRREGRTSALKGEFAGRSGWLCGGAERCRRRDRLAALITAAPATLGTRREPGELARALLDELARLGREVCRRGACATVTLELVKDLAVLRKAAWSVAEARAERVEVVHGGTLTGWRARLRGDGGRELDLVCGLSQDEAPSCLLELESGGRRFRYHSSAGAKDHAMLDLELLGEQGFMWMDPGMSAVGGALSR